jgi:hypothetical protein
MRSASIALLFGAATLVSTAALAQDPGGGAADLCKELLAYAEKKASEPPKEQARAPAGAPAPRSDGQGTGTQGGGSVSAETSKDTSSQSSAPTTAPVSTGAAPEATSSPHATDGKDNAQGSARAGAKDEYELAGGVTLRQVRETAAGSDRQSCRAAAQVMRRAGGDLPAELLALAAYEPDPAKRN